jgi:phenylacetate-coenzyme A ligase PaaK-like adenylate-forming protein
MNAPGFLLSPRLRRHYAAAQERLASIPLVGGAEWARRQLDALQRVWADASADVPYYAGLVADGRAPAEIMTWRDVQSIPELTREVLQAHPEQFIRRSSAPPGFIRTAGSTGTPLRIGIGQAERDLMRIVKVSAWAEFGYTPASRVFLIWGHAHLLGTGARGRVNQFKRVVADRLLGYRRVDAYRLNDEICRQYAEELIAFRPFALISYAAALDVFARYTEAFRDRFRALGLRFVLATAEAPPRPDTVARLEDLFGCPVVEEYGGAEFGQVAFRRSGGPFDVYHDLNYLECVPAGEAAAALVTSLYPRYLPLVRYRVGDALVGPTQLPHGHVSRFDAVAGRVNDAVRLDGGDLVHSVAVFHCIHQEDQVHAIQLLLDDDGIELSLVAGDSDRPSMERRIRDRLRQVHPALEQVRFSYVDDLQTTGAGKRRWFIDRRSPRPSGASRV